MNGRIVVAAFLIGAAALLANEPAPSYTQGVPSVLQKIGIDQKLDNQVPLDLTFRDENGQTVSLGKYFGSKPVVLALVYYECPMLCNMVLNGMIRAFRVQSFDIGNHFNVVTVSFNPKEQPALAHAKKDSYMKAYRRPGAENGWHFLTGDEPNIQKLAQSVGFRYTWDAAHNQYAHASGIMVLTPKGRVARYFYGIEYPPNDLRLGIIEASKEHIGSPVDAILLYCFHYDASTGRYTLFITNIIKLVGSATALALFGMIGFFVWRERQPKTLEPTC